ncbi:MAG: Na/Pi cotransporter family protein [Bacteroidales bacterium]|nr:Na/Pi cotransporter family protein [Bacteroidales bacterium]
MNYNILDFLTLIGSLGLFLFGMKLMSEALQKVAGNKMRQILAAMTSNRIKGVLTGILITAVIQSSSATTVMLVSFVNAGLLSLVESVGVIMGANIGTTVTAWLISLLGFKVNISLLSLPFIGIGFPLIFSKNTKRKSWGEFIIGFSLIFMGLEALKSSVPDIRNNPQILEFLSDYTNLGIISPLIFLLIGTLLTVIIQSSSATMALTLVMCNNGWIEFDLAAAMVLGENIGTTITANVAASVANTSAKRAARAHFIFNIFGVIWIMLVLPYFLVAIEWFVIKLGGQSPFTSTTAMPIALSIFHTSFNILNVIILIGFAPLIVKAVTKIVKQKEDEEEEFRLKYINTGLLSTSELSTLQAKKEIVLFSERVYKMFNFVKELFNETREKQFYTTYKKIEKYEEICDRMDVEIATYLTKISEGYLSKIESKRIRAMLTIIDNIESVGDSCTNIAKAIYRKKQEKIWFIQDIRNNVNNMFSLIDETLNIMNKNLDDDYHNIDILIANESENKINIYRDELKKEHLQNIETKKYKYQAGVIYNDIFSESEKLGDFVINVSESIEEVYG